MLEPEQAPVDQQDVTQLVVRLPLQELHRPVVVGFGALEPERDLLERERSRGSGSKRSRGGCRARRIRARAPGTCSGWPWPAQARRAATSTGPTSNGPRSDRVEVESPGRNAGAPRSGPAACKRSCPIKKWSNAVVGFKRSAAPALLLGRCHVPRPGQAGRPPQVVGPWSEDASEPPGPAGAGPLGRGLRLREHQEQRVTAFGDLGLIWRRTSSPAAVPAPRNRPSPRAA